jgi:hypothetical protein
MSESKPSRDVSGCCGHVNFRAKARPVGIALNVHLLNQYFHRLCIPKLFLDQNDEDDDDDDYDGDDDENG